MTRFLASLAIVALSFTVQAATHRSSSHSTSSHSSSHSSYKPVTPPTKVVVPPTQTTGTTVVATPGKHRSANTVDHVYKTTPPAPKPVVKPTNKK